MPELARRSLPVGAALTGAASQLPALRRRLLPHPATARYGLAAIQCPALVGDHLP